MDPNPPIVTLHQADVDIDGAPILHGIDLDIRRGEPVGIIGGNGSGKSTLLALIAGLRWPAPGRGRRRYDFGAGPEHDAVTARERITLLGHELQDTYIARRWNFRVRDIVRSGLTRSAIPKRRVLPEQLRQVDSLLARLAIADLAERRLLELSRGEQRRVLIARALAFAPALLLLDEPMSGLDAASRKALDAMLERAAADVTIVIATHRASELPRFITRRLRLDAGRLSADPGDGDVATKTAVSTAAARSNDTPAPPPAESADRSTLIELQGASVWLDGRCVLAPLDWQLRAGDHWLIEGPNGAGKSTLLRLLHGELRPAVGGCIRWPGLGDPRDVWTLRRRIALVSPELQARYRYPTRVFDAIASGFSASIGRVRAATAAQQERVRELLDAFELTPLQDRLLSSLSYGQRHRTLIARTLVTRPRVLLLDEPWEGLDTATTALVAGQLMRTIGNGTQLVCVSHVGARGLDLNRSLQLVGGSVSRVDGSAGPRESSSSARHRGSGSRPR